jgi:D-alanyl-D-alanine carboxypeptidase
LLAGDDIQGQLDAVVATGVPGVAVVATDPRGTFEAASGTADLATGEPLTAAHRFRIGSVTKIFVAALVLRLVDQGRLDLDQTAAPFVDDVTLRQLLNHSSGLDDLDFGPSFWESYRSDPAHRWPLGARDELQRVLQKPRLFPPGEGWAYHGSNYLVLGLVIEEETGMGLRDALRDHVFGPLGLQHTDLVAGPLRGACAHGYLAPDNPFLPGGSSPVDVTGIDVPFHRAGGGIVSTPGEIATMLRAQLRGELLPDRLRHEMLDAVESDWEETDRYGLGIGEISALMGRQRSSCGAAWGHLGFSVGYIAFALSTEDGDRQVVICANGHPPAATEVPFLDAAGRLAWNLYCNPQRSG